MTLRLSGSSEIFEGTQKRGAMFKKLYTAWKKLPDFEQGNIPLITLMTGLNRRMVFEDILPQLREAQRLDQMGVNPFDVWNNLSLICEVDRKMLPETGEEKPVTKTIRLGKFRKEVPVKERSEVMPEKAIPEEPYEPVKKSYRKVGKGRKVTKEKEDKNVV